jgi:hypothetical protein
MAGQDKTRPDPVIEAYMMEIDRSHIRENLRRSVTDRLRNLQELQRLAVEARRAGRRSIITSAEPAGHPENRSSKFEV